MDAFEEGQPVAIGQLPEERAQLEQTVRTVRGVAQIRDDGDAFLVRELLAEVDPEVDIAVLDVPGLPDAPLPFRERASSDITAEAS